ncbi:MAG: hypothetical protein WD469_03730 [Paenibacillaceae bacterium]
MTRNMIILIVSFTVILVISVTYLHFFRENKRTPNIYLIPMGYVGWVKIEFGQRSFPTIEKRNGHYVFEFPLSGKLKISNEDPEYGWAEDEYFYIDSQGKKVKELQPNVDFFGKNHESRNGLLIEQFFVGNSEEFRNLK